MANSNWNESLYTHRRHSPNNYDGKAARVFADYIHEADSRGKHSDFDFSKASVGGRYLKYGVENYGY